MKDKNCKHINAHLSTEPITDRTALFCDDCDFITEDPNIWADYELKKSQQR